ncbi:MULTISPECIES: hypothetical protein [Paraburkholderia]|uniref:Resolvase/invertase-type recombinase catalytic domain-containing protein n=1 Tax=Paraburkholderia podalyriae TaxID=1938811 RepID=A0ABR7PTM2_9BURK|nr:hypothetical protein [Paraburkholderia podalyriae]MBC8749600.1 hypothetical protein [Paraburkholderia podalyriae]
MSPGLTAAPNLPFRVSRRGCGRLIHPEPLHHLPQRSRLIRERRGRRRTFLDECRVLPRDLVHLRDRDAHLLNPGDAVVVHRFSRFSRDSLAFLCTIARNRPIERRLRAAGLSGAAGHLALDPATHID